MDIGDMIVEINMNDSLTKVEKDDNVRRGSIYWI